MKLDIATGLKASSLKWKNTQISWGDLTARLADPVRTGETFDEYNAASKGERSRIKDVGGFVGGYLRGGRRKPDRVVHRQILTLDLDFANLDVWDDLTLTLTNAAVLHSTHSHSPTSPKFRLVMPLARAVSPDEYVAVSRRVAGWLGIDLFDSTGFQPYRLMFWPSVSKDVDYYFRVQKGESLDPDAILATYLDWRDSSLWPTSGLQLDEMDSKVKKQQDPKSKRGLLGAFCRTYSVTEVLETFLKDKYESVNEGRYTYLEGSTAGGLITYDDLFAYSHHGTDPTSGMLCNAFDLLRVHRFGHLDTGTERNPIKKASYKAVCEFIREDKRTKRTLASERIGGALEDFGLNDTVNAEILNPSSESTTNVVSPSPEASSLDWVEDLEVDSAGKYKTSATNFTLIAAHDPAIGSKLQINLFDGKRYLTGAVPWRKASPPEPFRNVDYSGVRSYVERAYGISNTSKLEDALALEAERNGFHPVRTYLESAKWDGVERIDRFLPDYFGAEDNVYVRQAMRKTLVGAVSRVFEPGCKFDLVLVLVGEQGTGKSTIVRKLGGPWYSDTFIGVTGKESFEQVQGAWLIEIAELAGLRKAEVEAIKHFITKQADAFRPAYARTSENFLRQCIFIGTTNRWDFLRDPTGNRRFLPVDGDVGRIKRNIHKIDPEEVRQLWAEAYAAYLSGEVRYLSEEAEQLARVEQYKHSEVDERRGVISAYLNRKLPDDWGELDVYDRRMFLDAGTSGVEVREFVSVAEIWCECLGHERKEMDRYKTQPINDIMRTLPEWSETRRVRTFSLYGKQRYYQRLKKEI